MLRMGGKCIPAMKISNNHIGGHGELDGHINPGSVEAIPSIASPVVDVATLGMESIPVQFIEASLHLLQNFVVLPSHGPASRRARKDVIETAPGAILCGKVVS